MSEWLKKFAETNTAALLLAVLVAAAAASYAIGNSIGQGNTTRLREELALYERLKPEELRGLTSQLSTGLRDLKLTLNERSELIKLRTDRKSLTDDLDAARAELEVSNKRLAQYSAGPSRIFHSSDADQAIPIGTEYVGIDDISDGRIRFRIDGQYINLQMGDTSSPIGGCRVTLISTRRTSAEAVYPARWDASTIVECVR